MLNVATTKRCFGLAQDDFAGCDDYSARGALSRYASQFLSAGEGIGENLFVRVLENAASRDAASKPCDLHGEF